MLDLARVSLETIDDIHERYFERMGLSEEERCAERLLCGIAILKKADALAQDALEMGLGSTATAESEARRGWQR